MFKNLSLRFRIAAPLLAMTLGIVTISSLLIIQYYQRWTQAKGLSRSAEVILAISNAIHEIQKERAASVLFLNKIYSQTELDNQRKSTDQELIAIESDALAFPSADLREMANASLAKLGDIRKSVNEQKTPPTEVAKTIGVLVDSWIRIQMICAKTYHLDGLESALLSISIFEKSKESMGRLRALLNVVLGADRPINATTVSLLATHKSGILSNMESPGLTISSISRQEIDRLLVDEDWKTVVSTYEKVIEKSETGTYGFEAKKFSATITRVIDGLRNVIKPEIILTSGSIDAAATAARRSFIICFSANAFLIVFAIFMAFYVTHAVNRSLDVIARSLLEGAKSVSKIALQIAVESQKLAASTTEQASALQETTAAVEETNAMIKKNADNSKASAELSKQSHSKAMNGKKIVDEMSLSIREIAQSNTDIMLQTETSNKELSDIVRVIQEIEGKTRVINDIVFQTKLLSFNASVEAARAGEQGKGFAVVAEEVGNLAQMSGSSAKEISEMLDKSIHLVEDIVNNSKDRMGNMVIAGREKIEIGIFTAEKCGVVLEEIVANVFRVGTMATEISTACQEQSEGIAEITRAMSELDGVAHQNSAASEKTSSSAEELKGQAVNLQSMVFQLNELIHGSKDMVDPGAPDPTDHSPRFKLKKKILGSTDSRKKRAA